MAGPLDSFMPVFDVRERFAVRVRAPEALVYQAARGFDMQSPLPVRAIFRMRGLLMGSLPRARAPRGMVDELLSLGWGCLLERPGELFIGGAVCQPWLPNVAFQSVPADQFAGFAEPDLVRIGWTLETRELGANLTELSTETRAHATNDSARRRFLAYWRWARVGIYSIRWLLLPAIRKEAEARARA